MPPDHTGPDGAGPNDTGADDLVADETTGPTPIRRFAQTAAGSVFVAALSGLRDALEGRERDEAAIVMEHSGEPPFTEPIVLRLDPDNPADSIAMVRPWLRDDTTG
jgi:hypothetical protein